MTQKGYTLANIPSGPSHCDSFSQGKYGWDFTGNSNIPELHWYLENTVLIRRLKKDVLHELPDKVRQCVYVEITSKAKNMFTKMMAENDKINDKLENAKVRKQMEQQQKARMEKRLHLIQMVRDAFYIGWSENTDHVDSIRKRVSPNYQQLKNTCKSCTTTQLRNSSCLPTILMS